MKQHVKELVLMAINKVEEDGGTIRIVDERDREDLTIRVSYDRVENKTIVAVED